MIPTADTARAALPFSSVSELEAALREKKYVADRGLATTLYLTLSMQKPLLLEGEAGVGKTEIAKVLADMLGAPLIRLQCYEGLDASSAIYEWDYPRQMLFLRSLEAAGSLGTDQVRKDLFSEDFLLKRPLLQAIDAAHHQSPVLLIDEVDRADDEFEAYLLEVLSEYQITVPELGVFRAEIPPIVVLTSNRTRDVHDALKRRCLYHWVDHPSFEREVDIVRLRVPACSAGLAREIAAAVSAMRDLNLYKPPGVAETIDWATALGRLGVATLDDHAVATTLGAVLKYREDHQRVEQFGFAEIVKLATGRA